MHKLFLLGFIVLSAWSTTSMATPQQYRRCINDANRSYFRTVDRILMAHRNKMQSCDRIPNIDQILYCKKRANEKKEKDLLQAKRSHRRAKLRCRLLFIRR